MTICFLGTKIGNIHFHRWDFPYLPKASKKDKTLSSSVSFYFFLADFLLTTTSSAAAFLFIFPCTV